MEELDDNLATRETLEAKIAGKTKIISELQNFIETYKSAEDKTEKTIEYLKTLRDLEPSECLEIQRALDAKRRTLSSKDSDFIKESFIINKLLIVLESREALEEEIVSMELEVLESKIKLYPYGSVKYRDLQTQIFSKTQEWLEAIEALDRRKISETRKILDSQRILETQKTAEQSQEDLKILKKMYPNINFEATIISIPKFDTNGEVVRDERDHKVFIHKKLYELTDEHKELIASMNGFDFFFHGWGAGGEYLKTEVSSIYTTRPACLSLKQNPIISLDWNQSALPDVASCERAAKDLFRYLTNEIQLSNIGSSRLIGFSMGNLSLKAFTDEALANDCDLTSTHIYYQQIPVLHPKRLVFNEEQLKKIGCVGVNSIIDFRFKDRPFKMGMDIFHLISYTKTFIKEQAKKMGYAKKAIAEISGKKIARYVNDKRTEDYSLKTIIEKSFVQREESRRATAKTNHTPDR